MPTCLESYTAIDRQVAFLRLETARELMALPYATLLGIVLSTDGTTLTLDFASHAVTIKGKRLYEIFCSISAGQTQALFGHTEADEFSLSPTEKAPFIREVRIKAVQGSPT